MALNTTPATFSASEVVSATKMNTEVRDAFTGIQSAWTPFTPTWTASSVNPAIGNGSFSGSAHMRVGKTIHFRIVITMGSTTTYGTGNWFLALPITPVSTLGRIQFNASYLDTGTADRAGVATWDSATSKLLLQGPPTTAGAALTGVGSTFPHTWANTDQLVVSGTYEAA